MPFSSIKAFRLRDGRLYAGSGDAEDCHAVRHWLDHGGDKPSVKDFVGLVIDRGECFRMEEKLVAWKVEEKFHACGSGRDYAMAALHLGKTARESVELACLYDIHTGLPITELTESRS